MRPRARPWPVRNPVAEAVRHGDGQVAAFRVVRPEGREEEHIPRLKHSHRGLKSRGTGETCWLWVRGIEASSSSQQMPVGVALEASKLRGRVEQQPLPPLDLHHSPNHRLRSCWYRYLFSDYILPSCLTITFLAPYLYVQDPATDLGAS